MSGASLFCGTNFVSFGLSPSLIFAPVNPCHAGTARACCPIAICLFQMSSRAPVSRFSLQISLFILPHLPQIQERSHVIGSCYLYTCIFYATPAYTNVTPREVGRGRPLSQQRYRRALLLQSPFTVFGMY